MSGVTLDKIGVWSEIKLDILRRYATEYSRIMTAWKARIPPFRHWYIDGFAGAGSHISRETGDEVLGSPKIALGVEDLLRLTAEKHAFTWETVVARRIGRERVDQDKWQAFRGLIARSGRVSDFVRQKSDDELLDHYLFADGACLTNLGILWIGRREDRARLLYAPSVQFIRYDEKGRKQRKQTWDDFSLNPLELIESIWRDVPEWRDGEEVADGLFRKMVPRFDEVVVRELVANALVHRPYTTRGDIFINLHPDRLEVHNPGLLPLGVSPQNILHVSVKRNVHLAKVFYDLNLMEQEGSGYDRMYETLVLTAKRPPQVSEGDDRVVVVVESRILSAQALRFMESVAKRHDLRQKELIALGLLVQHGSLTALEFGRLLEIEDRPERLRDWLGRLPSMGLVTSRGRTRAKAYTVDLALLQQVEYAGPTTLKTVPPHRLDALIEEDVRLHPGTHVGETHRRVGLEIPRNALKRRLYDLVAKGVLRREGRKKGSRYFLSSLGAK